MCQRNAWAPAIILLVICFTLKVHSAEPPLAVLYHYPIEDLTPEKDYPLYSESILEGRGAEHFRSALSSFEKAYYQEALIKFSMLLEQYPNSELAEAATFFIADIYLQMAGDSDRGFLKKALEAYQKAVREYRESPNAARSLVKIGQIYMKLKFFYEAQANFRRVLAQYPKSPYAPKAQFGLAQNASLHGRDQESLEEFQRVIDQYPQSQEQVAAIFGKADFLYHLGEYKKAQALYEMGLRKDPAYLKFHLDTLLRMGETHLQNRRYLEARMALFPVINIDPQDFKSGLALMGLGDTYRLEGNRQMARKVYTEMGSGHFGGETGLLGDLSLALLEVEEAFSTGTMSILEEDPFERAMAVYQGTLQTPDASPWVQERLLRLADALRRARRLPEAVDLYRRFLDRYPGGPWSKQAAEGLRDAFWAVMEGQYRQGQYLKVVETFQENKSLILEGPDDEKLLSRVADSYMRAGLFSEAIGLYSIFETMLSEDSLFRLAEAFFYNFEDEQAVKTLNKFLVLYPKSPRRGEAIRLLGGSLFRMGSYDRAVKLYEDWLKGHPKDSANNHVFYQLAQAYQKIGDLPRAARKYQDLIRRLTVIEKDRSGELLLQAFFRMGDTLYMDHRYREALDAYRAGIKIDPDRAEADWVRYQIGNCFLKLRQEEKAQEVFVKLSDTSRDGLIREISSEKLKRMGMEGMKTGR